MMYNTSFDLMEYKNFQIAGVDDKTDLLMVITSFGILVYSVFTIVAGCLNDNSFEPPALVVANGLADFVQVIIFVENTES